MTKFIELHLTDEGVKSLYRIGGHPLDMGDRDSTYLLVNRVNCCPDDCDIFYAVDPDEDEFIAWIYAQSESDVLDRIRRDMR